MKRIPSLYGAFLMAAVGCLYIPAVTYFTNASDFPFGARALLSGMAVPFLCVLVVVLVILGNANNLLFSRLKDGAGKLKGVVSPAHVAVALLVFCLWLEGFLLSRGLPALTGEGNLYTSTNRLILDSLVWAAVIVAGLVFWRAIARRILFSYLCLTVILAAGVVDSALHSTGKADTHTSTLDVLDLAAFNPDSNVLVFVLDAMSTALAEKYLEDNPGAAEDLEGFVLFQNNLETAQSTQWSLPSILKGNVYQGGPVLGYQTDSFDAPGSLPRRFRDAGYDVFCSSTISLFNRIIAKDQAARSSESGRVRPSWQLYGLLFVRFAPYAAKNPIANRVGYDVVDTGEMEFGGNLTSIPDRDTLPFDEVAYKALMHAIQAKTSARPTFNFHHVHGAHKPYLTDSRGGELPVEDRFTLRGLFEQSQWTWDSVRKVLRAMKDAGVYDQATIVLLGDHGDRMGTWAGKRGEHASLLIKTPRARGSLRIADAPTSNSYLAAILPAVHLENKTLEEMTTGLPEERKIFFAEEHAIATMRGTDLSSLKTVAKTPVAQTLPKPTLLRDGVKYTLAMLDDRIRPNLPESRPGPHTIAVPADLNNADFVNGWGIKLTDGDDVRLAFLTRGKRKNVSLTFFITQLDVTGEPSPAVPLSFAMRLRDAVSGATKEVTLKEGGTVVTLADVHVADDSTIRLDLSASPFGTGTILITAVTAQEAE